VSTEVIVVLTIVAGYVTLLAFLGSNEGSRPQILAERSLTVLLWVVWFGPWVVGLLLIPYFLVGWLFGIEVPTLEDIT